jgi:predicted RecA/RadA family phage recombinase
MAQAVIQGREVLDRTLTLAHTAVVFAGDVIVSNGQVLVATNKANAGEEISYFFRGPVAFPKATSEDIAVGDVCYFNASKGFVCKSATGNVKAGICLKAAAKETTTVLVQLSENK